MKVLCMALAALVIAGCSTNDKRASQRPDLTNDENQVAIPAASNLGQAERSGYINEGTNPETYPLDQQ